jgi:hypothetical protein
MSPCTRSDRWAARNVSLVTVRELLINDLPRLKGKHLACWCPLVDEDGNSVPCHADVLLELANRDCLTRPQKRYNRPNVAPDLLMEHQRL